MPSDEIILPRPTACGSISTYRDICAVPCQPYDGDSDEFFYYIWYHKPYKVWSYISPIESRRDRWRLNQPIL